MRQLTGFESARKWSREREAAAHNPADATLVRDVIHQVETRGDEALNELSQRFDVHAAGRLAVEAHELEAAHAAVEPELLAAIRLSVKRVRNYYSRQREDGFSFSESDSSLGMMVRPVDSVGCYIPGGQAPLFSTLIMTAVPAQLAGVRRVAVASPPAAGGLPHSLVMAVAHELGLGEVYAVGGAQAIAALALGTGTIPRVDKVVGPGNRFVMHAKQQLSGRVGIESLPGPTETLVLADGTADVNHVLADLLAQAEHAGAVPVLVTDSARLREQVLAGLPAALSDLPTAAAASESLEHRGAAILAADLEEATEIANELAPEHLCLLVSDPEPLLVRIRNAGGVFVGHSSMEALGDYVAGPSHVMPTGTSARFASFLNLRDFQKVIPVIRTGPALLAEIGRAGALLARSEGLEAHARAIESRLEGS